MPSNLNLDLDYYYGTEEDRFNFYRVPKTLLTDPRYKSVSIEAKVLYGLLLDRMGLSIKNGWIRPSRSSKSFSPSPKWSTTIPAPSALSPPAA